MEAAKKIYENSYHDRLDVAVSAKAYLDHIEKEYSQPVSISRSKKNTGRLCNLFGILSSLIYCALIFMIVLYPLMKETELHKLKAAHSSYKIEVARLNSEIEDAKALLRDQTVINHIKQIATEELGLVSRSTGNKIEIQTDKYYTLEEARENYYNKTYHKALQGKID